MTDLRFLDPAALVDRAAFNERFGVLNNLAFELGNEYLWEKSIFADVVSVKHSSGRILSQFSNSQYGKVTMELYRSYTINPDKSLSVSGEPVTVEGYFNGAKPLPSAYLGYYGIAEEGGVAQITNSSGVGGNNTTSGYGFGFYQCDVLLITQAKTCVGYVNSHIFNTYPPVTGDGYSYIPIGQLGSKIKVVNGTYRGNGICGVSNQNVLTFEFEPKLILIRSNRASGEVAAAFVYNCPAAGFNPNYSYCSNIIWDGASVRWYAENVNNQLNENGITYHYLALG